jgi:hypothetical protein
MKDKDDQYFALGIHEKGRAAAESLAFTRFQMFRAVYWHHAVRAAKAMLQRAAYEWLASKGAGSHDAAKNDLYAFVLESSADDDKEGKHQADLFAPPVKAFAGRIGDVLRPQWSFLALSDLLLLEWLHERSNDTGQRLLNMIATRTLYKRVFVLSASQDLALWKEIEEKSASHERLHWYSEKLRDRLLERLDGTLAKAMAGEDHYHVTGVGDPIGDISAAAAALKLPGSVLLDVPKPRRSEVLRYYPEELHRGQREEFEGLPFLSVSELWNLLSDNLHQTASNIRVFVDPKIDILRRARSVGSDDPILPKALLDEELRNLFKLEEASE